MNITIENKKQKAIELMQKLDIYKPYIVISVAETKHIIVVFIPNHNNGAYNVSFTVLAIDFIVLFIITEIKEGELLIFVYGTLDSVNVVNKRGIAFTSVVERY